MVAPLSRSRYTPFGTDGTSAVAETQVWREEPPDSGTYDWVTLDPTEPITQTDTLYQGDTLERELGIYFTGDGRYYDPWLGKYLQPDPIGGPPLIPQAADRYQYAGNSPTGVGYASSEGWPGYWDIAVDLGAWGAGKAWGWAAKALFSGYGQAYGRLRVYATHRLVNDLVTHKGVLHPTARKFGGKTWFQSDPVRDLGAGRYEVVRTGRVINRADLQNELLQKRGYRGWWPGQVAYVPKFGPN